MDGQICPKMKFNPLLTIWQRTAFAFAYLGYWFLYAEFETGSKSDGGGFRDSNIYTKLENNTLILPPPRDLPLGNGNYCSESRGLTIPILFVADEVFLFSQYCMRP